MPIGLGSPYRPPCAGSWPDPIIGVLGSRDQHCNDADNGKPVFHNVTKVGGSPISGGTVVTCGSGDTPSIVTPDACSGGATLVGVNCYLAASPAAVANFSTCRQIGFKNLIAGKAWQGMDPFTDASGDGCSGPSTAPGGTKYRTITVVCSVNYVELGVDGHGNDIHGDPILPASGSWGSSRSYTAGRYTGNVTENSCSDSANLGDSSLFAGLCLDNYGVRYACGSWNGGGGDSYASTLNDPTAYPTGPWDGTTVPQLVVTLRSRSDEAHLHFTVENHYTPTATSTTDVVVTLSDPYTSADVNADCTALLAMWAGYFEDAAVYPWRAGADCNLAPIIMYDEAASSNPDAYYACCGGCTVGSYTGNVLGLPLPAGYDPYFDPLFNVVDPGTLCDGELFIKQRGAFAPSWCPRATLWLDYIAAENTFAGAWASYLWNRNSEQIIYAGRLLKCAWAETIMFSKPSHNYARPCGPDDAAAIDQTTATCTGGVLSGTTRFPGCPNPCPAPTTSGYEWNDTGAKGDFLFKDWAYDFRDSAIDPTLRPVTEEFSGFTATQAAICHTPCCPNVALICPFVSGAPIFNFSNQVAHALPDLTLDPLGALYNSRVEQWMTDPLWQPPAQCPANPPWTEDDGSCTGIGTHVYMLRPFEEARLAPPSGAPAYPSGCGVNYSGYIAAVNAGGATIPECQPPTPGVCEYARWFTQLLQEENCCGIPEDECADYDP